MSIQKQNCRDSRPVYLNEVVKRIHKKRDPEYSNINVMMIENRKSNCGD
jgi:hypothetical protein